MKRSPAILAILFPIFLVASQAGIPRYPPPHEPEAPGTLRGMSLQGVTTTDR